MPTLTWIGKDAVVNHHQEVPYHLLRDVPELGCGPPDSGTAVEQLIGRVLRLPGARRKQAPELNRAYALATSHSFATTARALEDALVMGNGFNPLEAKDLIVTPAGFQTGLDLSVARVVAPEVGPMAEIPDSK